MTTIPIGSLRSNEKIKKLEREAIEAGVKCDHLPKEFEYFCPACLFQTNEFTVCCPKCGKEGLVDSGKGRFRRIG